MRDLDELLRPDVSLAATEAAQPFDYAAIERRAALRRRGRSVISLAAAAAVVATAVVVGQQLSGSRGAEPLDQLDDRSTRPMPTGDAALRAGTYLAPKGPSSTVAYSITFPAGWQLADGDEYGVNLGPDAEVSVLPFVVEEIFADACLGEEGHLRSVGPDPQELVTALLAQTGPIKSTPVETTLGGYPATRIDLRAPQSLQAQDCRLPRGLGFQLWMSQPNDYLVLDDTGVVSVYVVDVDGRRQVFATQYRSGTSQQRRAELQQVIDSIRIQK
jgi:hypothetical protein